MITFRVLPPEEFPRLALVADDISPDPKIARVIVGEEAGEIVARSMLMQPVHIEGTWVREDHRGSPLGKMLLDRVEQEAKSCGLQKLFAYALDPLVASYLRRMHYSRSAAVVFTKDI